jgi:hypothetical protein
MGILDDLDFSKATEPQNRDLPDGKYLVTLGKTYTRLTRKGGGIKYFTEFQVDTGEFAGRETAWRQAVNDNLASALTGCIAASYGYDLNIPAHKEAFERDFSVKGSGASRLKKELGDAYDRGQAILSGKKVWVEIKTIKTNGGHDFRRHDFQPYTATA